MGRGDADRGGELTSRHGDLAVSRNREPDGIGEAVPGCDRQRDRVLVQGPVLSRLRLVLVAECDDVVVDVEEISAMQDRHQLVGRQPRLLLRGAQILGLEVGIGRTAAREDDVDIRRLAHPPVVARDEADIVALDHAHLGQAGGLVDHAADGAKLVGPHLQHRAMLLFEHRCEGGIAQVLAGILHPLE